MPRFLPVAFETFRLAVPFVAKRVNLVGEFAEILIRAAAVVLNDGHQPASCHEKPLKYGIDSCGSLLLRALRNPFGNAALLAKHMPSELVCAAGIRCFRIPAEYLADCLREQVGHLIGPVVHENLDRRVILKCRQPT